MVKLQQVGCFGGVVGGRITPAASGLMINPLLAQVVLILGASINDGVFATGVSGVLTLTWRSRHSLAQHTAVGVYVLHMCATYLRTWHTAVTSCPRQGCTH